MPSYQSELGGGGDSGVAEELAKGQRAISIAEFFEKNKHMLGFDSGARGLVTAVKEAVDNALDATEEAGILPDIYVEIAEAGDYYRLVIEDNGPGITKEQVPKVFGKLLYGSRFHAREQSRGQQGIGISAAVLYSQLTSGKPAKITSKTQGDGEAQYFELIIDTDENEPEISVEDTTTWERPHGTRIELEMEANMRARQQLHDYIKHTAVVNPHARLEFREPSEHLKYERATDQLPAETTEIRPHPHGVELGTLIKMLGATDSYSVSGFLQSEFTRVGQKTAESVVAAFRDRHFGREMAWKPPASHEDSGAPSAHRSEGDEAAETADVRAALVDAVNGKGADATEQFAGSVADAVAERERIAHHELVELVDAAAEDAAESTGKTFGSSVRENAVGAAWSEITAQRAADLYQLVDEATTSRKDDAAVEALARRIATAFEGSDDPRNRVTRRELEGYVTRAAERTKERDDVSFGETARENVVEAVWSNCRSVPDEVPKVSETAGDRDTASELMEAMRETDILAPPTDCLAPITAELLEAGLRKEYDADFFATATRDAEVHGGDPFIVEAGIAYGGDLPAEGQVGVLRFANRVPLVYQRGACATTDVVKGINWRNYGLDQPGGSGMPNGPAVLMVHVASTNVPFTSESKDAIANVPAIEDEIELALREAARDLKRYLNKRRSLEKRRRKQDVIADILPRMAEKLSEVTGREELNVEDSLARIMNNVLVERQVEDGRVRLVVANHSDTNADLDVTDIVSEDPGEVATWHVAASGTESHDVEGAQVVEMDGEWFVKWAPSVGSGEQAVLEYDLGEETTFDIQVEGVEDEKLTVNA
ncbi:DNA topoisomerase VI subunit B [Halomarina litorea]|uniref:DNA topoisomerase VI subunit B n=1 Tax=Halomarina litorea TaxID=2961595 RepID=UPI0020C58DE3|nr:DNA topoisomerase VI subunit B [Halomarina sp. BCD28]